MKPASHFDDSIANNAFGFRELTLAQMLGDPIVRDLMRSDRVSPLDIRKILSGRGSLNLALAA
jgi:hypothetical protein